MSKVVAVAIFVAAALFGVGASYMTAEAFHNGPDGAGYLVAGLSVLIISVLVAVASTFWSDW